MVDQSRHRLPAATAFGRSRLTVHLAVAALCLFAIFYLDRRIALYVHHHQPEAVDRFFDFITDFARGEYWFGGAALALIVSLIMWRRAGNLRHAVFFRQINRCAIFFIVTMALTGLFGIFLKPMFGRLRPKFLLREDIMAFEPFQYRLGHGDISFPSGHAQSIVTAMTILGLFFPRWRVPFIVIAVAVASSRIFVNAHFFSDVVFGSYIGFFGAILCYAWCRRRGINLQIPPLARVRASPLPG